MVDLLEYPEDMFSHDGVHRMSFIRGSLSGQDDQTNSACLSVIL